MARAVPGINETVTISAAEVKIAVKALLDSADIGVAIDWNNTTHRATT